MIRPACIAVGWVLFAVQASPAQAMLIDSLDQSLHPSACMPDGAAGTSRFRQPAQQDLPLRFLNDPLPHALHALSGGTSGSTGMGSAATGGTSLPVQAAISRTHEAPAATIVAYLTRELKVLLPVRFLDGVFRPPRAARMWMTPGSV